MGTNRQRPFHLALGVQCFALLRDSSDLFFSETFYLGTKFYCPGSASSPCWCPCGENKRGPCETQSSAVVQSSSLHHVPGLSACKFMISSLK